MSLFLKLSLFLTVLLCVRAQITLTQSGSEVRKPGENARLQCQVSGFDANGYWMSWFRQAPGKGLEWVVRYYSAFSPPHYSSDAVKGRFTASTDSSTFYLQMNSLKPEDSAVYYCARDRGYYFDYWGPGTFVAVTSEPVSAPMVYPLVPCCIGLGSREPVTIGCLATGYLPDPVNMTWNSGSITEGVRTASSVYSSDRRLYMRSSQLTVPAGSWINSTYQCSVEHEYTGLKQDKKVTVIPCTAPSVKTFLSQPCDMSHPRNDNVNATTVDVMCLMWGYHPGHLQVQWLANGRPTSLPASTTSPSKGKDGWFSASSRLTVAIGEWNRGTLYSCKATHTATKTSTLTNISKCAEPCPTDMRVFLLPPSFEDLYLEKRAYLTCLITSMKTSDSFEVLWTRENGAKLEVVTDDPQLHDNGTISVVSRLAICSEEWESGERFSCAVRHPDLPSPVKVDIFKLKETSLRPPAVYLLPPSPEEVALQEIVTLTCLVKGFYPKDIFVRWLQKGQEVSKSFYTTTNPKAAITGGNYFLYSSLNVEAAAWEAGTPFSCVVGHEGLPMHLTQKTIDKFTGKPSSINVSLVMSDSAGTCY